MQSSELTQHYSWLLSQAKLFTSHDYEDLAHDTYVRAVNYLSSFTPGTNLKGWLFTIMRSIFLNKFRNNLFTQSIELCSSLEYRNSRLSSVDATIELSDVNMHLSEMSERNATSLILYVNGYQYDEIAKMTDTPIGTVKSRIHIARKAIREMHKNDR